MQVYAKRHLESREQAREMLARAVQAQWGLSPLPDILREEGGKPRFRDLPDYHFNLSHSAAHGLCALDHAPVGVDIQLIRRDLRSALPARVCSREELSWLAGQTDYWGAFAQLWCMKEARVKWSGEGIKAGLRTAAVPLPERGEGLYHLDDIWFRNYDIPGFACVVCGKNPPPENIVWL